MRNLGFSARRIHLPPQRSCSAPRDSVRIFSLSEEVNAWQHSCSSVPWCLGKKGCSPKGNARPKSISRTPIGCFLRSTTMLLSGLTSAWTILQEVRCQRNNWSYLWNRKTFTSVLHTLSLAFIQLKAEADLRKRTFCPCGWRPGTVGEG